MKMQKRERLIDKCPICDSERLAYKFIAFGYVISACQDCDFMFRNPQNCENTTINELLFDSNSFSEFVNGFATQESEPVLWIDTPNFDSSIRNGKYDLCAVTCLDCVSDPDALLCEVFEALKPNGKLFLQLPSLDSLNARKSKQKWMAFEQGRLYYFSNATIQNLLCKCGYEEITIKHANDQGVYISCVRGEKRKRKVVSIIIPVYNEQNTVRELLESVYKKNLEHLCLTKEIIIIESNSTDGTRNTVEQFVNEHPEVIVVYEDKPCGKGHAVRNGFVIATGDFIAIQDGDLEYDINDYDQLLKPLVNYRRAFILGSRHTGDWQMRRFKDESVRAWILNLGQLLFTWLINAGCGTKLKDPFTMYKLFRRDCLFSLCFDGNRFEIDWEIVIKLIRKGYIPEEVPVNYVSRSFSEGKKVRMLKDPILWMLCFVKYRFFYKL
jgi:hypothetical protein